MDYDSLIALGIQVDEGEQADGASHLDPEWLVELARVVALQLELNSNLAEAEALFELVRAGRGVDALDELAGAVYSQVLVKLGRFDRLRSIMPSLKLTGPYQWSLSADSMNPFTGASDDLVIWLTHINTIFTSVDNEPVTLRPGMHSPFDRMTAQAPPRGDDALVTVIMPTYKPGHSIATAVDSITNQSWRNLELLIVDDASPPEYNQLLRDIVATDGRIRIILASSNGGAYRARNLGLEQARGEYVTFQDADDWSHPQRIERQVDCLRRHEHALASRSWAVRAFPDLTFTYVGYPPNRPNMSSLLFRRDAVLEKIGFFDTARKSADAEFEGRLHAAVPDSLLTMESTAPLAIVQLRHDSLSRSDVLPGWSHWTRFAYRDAYRLWHSAIRHGQANPHLPSHATSRPFPLPDQTWSSSPKSPTVRRRFDVLVVNDWRRGQGPQLQLIDDIRAMLGLGLRVGVAHVEAPTPLAQHRQLQSREIQELINDGSVDFVHIEQRLHVELVLVCNPSGLQFLPGSTASLSTGRLVLLAQFRVANGNRSALDFNVPACTANAERLFSQSPLWVPREPATRELLADQLTPNQLAAVDLPYSFDPARWHVQRRRPSRLRPVVGRPAIDHWSHYPASKEALLGAYPDDDRIDVRILGGTATARRIINAPSIPPNWVSFTNNQLSRRSYLAQLDFFVYFPHPNSQSPERTPIAEAMASGCVVVFPPRFKQWYGDSAAYCQHNDVIALILEMYGSTDRYDKQQRRGMEQAKKEQNLFTDRMMALLRPKDSSLDTRASH